MDSGNALIIKVREIAQAIRENSGRALLVGGFVRDELLGKTPKDADMEVYGISSATLRQLLTSFGRVDCVGESFQVYKLSWRVAKHRYELDISLPRFDRKIGHGHRGFEVQGDPFATTEDAARRRDFTINAMMQDPLTGELIDHFGGQRDLEHKLLRVVDERHFAEDSLRVLRAMQFGARFELKMEEKSIAICHAIDLSDLPAERLWGEWEKLLSKTQQPSRGLHIAQQLHILKKLFPYLDTALNTHGEKLSETVDRAAALKVLLKEYPRRITLMLAAICVYLLPTEREKFIKKLGVFTLDNYNVRQKVLLLSSKSELASDWYTRRHIIADKDFRILATRIEPRFIYLLARAQGQEDAATWFWENATRLHVQEKAPAPLLQGRHLLELGLQPSPRIGEIIKAVYAQQLEKGFTAQEEAIAAAKELL